MGRGKVFRKREQLMRWETAWHVWGMADGQSEENEARKLYLGPDGKSVKECGFYPVSHDRMTM